MRKKFFYVAMAALMCACLPVGAQEKKPDAGKAPGCGEKGKQRVERLAGELGLQGDTKESFTKLYARYQEEMKAACPAKNGKKAGKKAGAKKKKVGKKKELTAEEATRRMQERFDREDRMIETQKKRLEIKKKYYAEFGKILTPEQLCKVFAPRRVGRCPAGNRPQGKHPAAPGGHPGGRYDRHNGMPRR